MLHCHYLETSHSILIGTFLGNEYPGDYENKTKQWIDIRNGKARSWPGPEKTKVYPFPYRIDGIVHEQDILVSKNPNRFVCDGCRKPVMHLLRPWCESTWKCKSCWDIARLNEWAFELRPLTGGRHKLYRTDRIYAPVAYVKAEHAMRRLIEVMARYTKAGRKQDEAKKRSLSLSLKRIRRYLEMAMEGGYISIYGEGSKLVRSEQLLGGKIPPRGGPSVQLPGKGVSQAGLR